MNKKSRIYVAGHNGLVGSNITKQLHENSYHNVIGMPSKHLDLRIQDRVTQFFKDQEIEYVFLSAAKVGGILANNTYKADFIYDNTMIAANVINSAKNFDVRRLLNLGSSCIYPKFATQPINESQLLTGLLEETNEPYAISKIFAIKLCKYYREQYGSDFISLMPTNLYGIGDNYNLQTSHVLPALLRKTILAKHLEDGDYISIRSDLKKYGISNGISNGYKYPIIDILSETGIDELLKENGITKNYITVWGSGEVFREFLNVKDLASACIYFMNIDKTSDLGDFVNIGTGLDISIKTLVYMIKDVVGFKGGIKFDKSKPDGTPRKVLDISKAKDLGWSPKIDIIDGLKEVYEDYIKSND